MAQRRLNVIAMDIHDNWSKVGKGINPHAYPYLEAMLGVDNMDDMYGQESGESLVRYFLSNAGSWRGEDARRIKAELKSML